MKKCIDGVLGNFAGVFADGSHKLKKLLLLLSRGQSGKVGNNAAMMAHGGN
jgi:hypothetical protein